MKTLAKMAKVNFFKTLEISQSLPTVWEVFIQEKLMNLIKQSLWHCNLNCSHIPLFRSTVTLKNSSLANMVLIKTSSFATIGLDRPHLELLKKSHSQSIVPVWPVLHFPGKAWLELRTCSAGNILSSGYLSKMISGNCLIDQLLRGQ